VAFTVEGGMSERGTSLEKRQRGQVIFIANWKLKNGVVGVHQESDGVV
jgi:hypothetical protein